MSKGMLIYIIVMGWTLIIYGGMTYLIVKKKEFSLISGFGNRPKEEQEYLIENGFIEKLGKIMLHSFYLMIIAAILPIFPIPYGLEIGWGLFIVYLLGSLMYLQKYEVPSKRKKYRWIVGALTVVTFGSIIGVFLEGSQDNEILIENGTFIISGTYGVEWPIDNVEEVKLLDKLPEILMKTNGFSSGNARKGKFKLVEPYGAGKLFIKGNEGPYLYVAIKDDYVILNRETEQEITMLYEKLRGGL